MSLISRVLNAAAADPVLGPAYTKLAVRAVVEKEVNTGSISVEILVLKVVQSAELKAPRLAAEAVGRLKV